MILSKKSLSDFLRAGSAIAQNNILPILSNVCFKGGRAIKNNLREFISLPFTHESDFLIDEKILSNFIGYATGDSIKITITGRRLTMSDDSGAVMSCDSPPVTEYPINSQPEGKPFFLSAAFFEKLHTAMKFTGKDQMFPHMEAVYIRGGKIGGTDRWIMYFGDIDPNIPEMILSKEACRLFSGIDMANGYQNDRYYFAVTTTGAIYGAVKTEHRFLDMSVVLPKEIPTGMTVNSTEIIKFNSAASTAAAGRYIDCIIKDGLTMSMADNDYEINFSKVVYMHGVNLTPFKYQPSLLNKVLTAIPDENTWAQDSAKIYISNTDFVCIVMGIVNVKIM